MNPNSTRSSVVCVGVTASEVHFMKMKLLPQMMPRAAKAVSATALPPVRGLRKSMAQTMEPASRRRRAVRCATRAQARLTARSVVAGERIDPR